MKLIYHPASPYARKVRVVAIELGLGRSVELVHVDLTLGRYNRMVGAANPIGKVPVAIADDGEVLHDSSARPLDPSCPAQAGAVR